MKKLDENEIIGKLRIRPKSLKKWEEGQFTKRLDILVVGNSSAELLTKFGIDPFTKVVQEYGQIGNVGRFEINRIFTAVDLYRKSDEDHLEWWKDLILRAKDKKVRTLF